MLEKFFPKLMVDKIQDIDLDLLKKNNIKGMILDIDNTLVASHVKEADENAVEWIERAKSSGFKMCIVSNASRKRVVKFNEKLKLFAIYRALKPGSKAYKKAARLMDLELDQVAVVGDQIFTDVYGGNRIGMYTILVKPIHKKESILVMLKRYPEKLVLSKYMKKVQQEDKQ
ncbi:MAG TPA: YqeG family HAD IIIA-type phosphatase [Clostridiaceae bacterium]|nr:YqeG family HAD IIIA-type phosphatase [Clostridiaceae bacterium]